MRIVVTGADGFLGRLLTMRLAALGHAVVAGVRREPQRPRPGAAEVVAYDLADQRSADALVDGADVVYHLAWSTIPATAEEDPLGDVATNVLGSLRLMEAVARSGRRRLVFTSSGGTLYGSAVHPARETDAIVPVGCYGIAKATVEQHLDLHNRRGTLDAVILRMANPFGPGQMRSGRMFGVIAHFVSRVVAGEPIVIFGDGTVIRDFLAVEDAVDALVRVGLGSTASTLYNIGSGRGRSLAEVARIVMETVGQRVAVDHLPPRRFDAHHSVLDVGRAAGELDWRPRTPFEVAVARLAELHEKEPET